MKFFISLLLLGSQVLGWNIEMMSTGGPPTLKGSFLGVMIVGIAFMILKLRE